MSNLKIRRLIALGCWVLLQGYFLVFHFTSWAVLPVFCTMLLIALFTTILSKKVEGTSTTAIMGTLLGTLWASMLGYYIIDQVVPAYSYYARTPDWLITRLWNALLNDGFKSVTDSLGNHVSLLIVLIVIFILTLVAKRLQDHIVFLQACKYMRTLIIFTLLILWTEGWCALISLATLVAFLFFLCDLFNFLQSGSIQKTGKQWFTWIGVLWLISFFLNPSALYFAAKRDFVEEFLLLKGFSKSNALFLIIVMLLTATGIVLMERREKKQNCRFADAYPFWAMGLSLFSGLCASVFYVGYWPIFVLLYLIAMLYCIFKYHPCGAVSQSSALLRCGLLGLINFETSFLFISASRGWLLPWVISQTGVLVITAKVLWKKELNWKKEGKFYFYLLPAIAVFTASLLWQFHRNSTSFIALICVFILHLVFVWFFAYNKGAFPPQRQWGAIFATVLFVLLCFRFSLSGGSSIKVTIDPSGIQDVSVSARNEEDPVSSVEYYWLDEFPSLGEPLSQVFSERELTNKSQIPANSGRLRVKAVTKNHIVTERTIWVHRFE